MFLHLVLMLGVLLNSAVSQDTSGDHQCGPGQEQCVQNSVERMRYEMDAMQDDLRRLIKENQQLSTESAIVRIDLQRVNQENQELKGGLERVERENQQLSTENVHFRKDLQRVGQEVKECKFNLWSS